MHSTALLSRRRLTCSIDLGWMEVVPVLMKVVAHLSEHREVDAQQGHVANQGCRSTTVQRPSTLLAHLREECEMLKLECMFSTSGVWP